MHNQIRLFKVTLVLAIFLYIYTHYNNGNKKEEFKLKNNQKIYVNSIPKDYENIVGLIQNNEYGPARIRLKKKINNNPEVPFGYFLYGLTKHREKNYSESSLWFKKANEKKTIYIPTYHFLGWSLYYQGKLNQSEESFLSHLELNTKKEPDDYFGIGLIYLNRGKPTEAIKKFNTSMNLLQNNPTRKLDLAKNIIRKAEALSKIKKYKESSILYNQAIDLVPDQVETYYRLSRIYRHLGKIEESNTLHQEYIKKSKKYSSTPFPE